MTSGVTLRATYYHMGTGHRLVPFSVDRRAGAVNERVLAHNVTTGKDETWSTRLFLTEHERRWFVGGAYV